MFRYTGSWRIDVAWTNPSAFEKSSHEFYQLFKTPLLTVETYSLVKKYMATGTEQRKTGDKKKEKRPRVELSNNGRNATHCKIIDLAIDVHGWKHYLL